jgi:hypothetical protein
VDCAALPVAISAPANSLQLTSIGVIPSSPLADNNHRAASLENRI